MWCSNFHLRHSADIKFIRYDRITLITDIIDLYNIYEAIGTKNLYY